MFILTPVEYTLLSNNVPDTNVQTWDSTTTYNKDEEVYIPDLKSIYKSKVDGNDSYPPDSDTWDFMGIANKYRMFDQYFNSATTNDGDIIIEVEGYGIDAIFIGNVMCEEIEIEIRNGFSDEVIETKTYNMVSDPSDWLNYFYGDWLDNYKSYVIYQRQTITGHIKAKITLKGSFVSVGIMMFGSEKYIGALQYNFNVILTDYSEIKEESNGDTYLKKGANSKHIEGDIYVPTSKTNEVYKFLQGITGTPILIYDNTNDDEFISSAYGYLRDNTIAVNSPTYSVLNILLKGLI